MQDGHVRVRGWDLALQPFDFMVTHKPGTANKNADGLLKEWDSLIEEEEMSGTDILTDLTDLNTLPASRSLKNKVQVRVSWQSPGLGLINKNRLGNKEMAKNKETTKNKETAKNKEAENRETGNKEGSTGRGLMDKRSLQNKEMRGHEKEQ